MADKSIKIAFAVDPQSARAAIRLISDVNREVEKLVQTATRAGAAMAALGAGSGGGVRSGRVGPGTGGTAHIATPAGAPKVGGIVGSLIGTDAQGLRGVVNGTTQAFSSVSAGVKTFVDRTENDLKRLQRTVDGLGTSMKTMSGMGPSGPGFSSGGGRQGPPGIPDMTGSAQYIRPKAPPPIPDMTAHAQFLHSTGRMSPAGTGGYTDRVLGGFMNGGIGGGIRALGGAGMAAGAAYAGFRAGDALNGWMEGERSTRLDYTINEPFDRMRRRAAIAAPFLQMHHAVQARDAAGMLSYEKALARPDIAKSLRSSVLRRETVEHTLQAMTAKGAGREIANSMRNWMGARTGFSTDDVSAFINGLPVDEVSKSTARDILKQRAVASLDPQAAAQLGQAMHDERTIMDPTQAMLLNNVYGNALGRVQTQRSMGMSTGNVRLPSGQMVSRVEHMEQQLMRGGWTTADYAQGRSHLLGVGTGYGKALGPIGIVSAGIGGLSNAAELMKMGGSMTGSVAGGGGFYRGAQSAVGRGGLDVAVGRDLFGSMGQHAMQTGQYGGAGATDIAGMMAGLVSGGGSYDVGGQQRRAGMIQSGMAAFGGFTSGSKAPLYQATSLMGAVGAMGGYSGGAEALTKMDPALLTQIARGGAVPDWAQASGIGQDQASKFLAYQRKAPLFEVTDELVSGSAKMTLARVREAEETGGDFMSVVNSDVGSRRKGESAKQFNKRRAGTAQAIAINLGAAMFQSGTVDSPEAGAGIFLGQMAQDKEMAPFLKGGGVGAAAPKGAEKESLSKQAELMASHSRTIAEKIDKLITRLDPAAAEKGAEAGVGVARNATDDSMSGSIDNLVAALQQMKGAVAKAKLPSAMARVK